MPATHCRSNVKNDIQICQSKYRGYIYNFNNFITFIVPVWLHKEFVCVRENKFDFENLRRSSATFGVNKAKYPLNKIKFAPSRALLVI